MIKNWRTNLGGAISVTGTSLIGVGVLSQLTQLSPNTSTMLSAHQLALMWYVALAGFVLSGIGKGLSALFQADAVSLQKVASETKQMISEVAAQSNVNTANIQENTEDIETKVRK